MAKVIILGSGAAPGVPSLSYGFGNCDPKNPKNYRLRTGTYVELSGVKLLIDTSPDLRLQLINNNIRDLDAVFYTHSHADHLHGIDDLREINRITGKAIDTYASKSNMEIIRMRFPYLIAENDSDVNPVFRAALRPKIINYNESFFIKDLKVTPINLIGHNVESTGFIFNDGELVFIADFREIAKEDLGHILRKPKLMVMPLTTPRGTRFHAGLDDILAYNEQIEPKRMVINHMAIESDYNEVYSNCPNGVEPAYDGMVIEW